METTSTLRPPARIASTHTLGGAAICHADQDYWCRGFDGIECVHGGIKAGGLFIHDRPPRYHRRCLACVGVSADGSVVSA